MSFKDKLDIPEIEAKCQKIWNASDIYKWDSTKSKEEIFSIDTPPPTVSGELHMGHVFSYTQVDFLSIIFSVIIMSLVLAVYGKGGIGKSTTSANFVYGCNWPLSKDKVRGYATADKKRGITLRCSQ